MKLTNIANMVASCIILHNMCVSDRIMDGNVHAIYDPSQGIGLEGEEINYPSDLNVVQNNSLSTTYNDTTDTTNIGVTISPNYVQNLVSQSNRFKELTSNNEHQRLQNTLMKLKNNN